MNRRNPLTLMALLSLTGTVLAAQTPIVDPDSHRCLDVSAAGVAESSCGAGAGQQFLIAQQPDGYAQVSDATGRDCLTAAATHLGVKKCNASQTDQMFKPIAQQLDGYALLNRRSGLCIASAGSRVSLADCESKPATSYRLPGWATAQPARRSATGGRSNNTVPPPASGLVISGLHIQGDYALYGNKFDGATLTNSTITGSLKIDGVHNLRVQGNHLNSVWFRGQQPTDAVTIEGNEIAGAANDCVHIHDGGVYPTHVLIENNNIYNCGSKYPASGLYHAIYDQVPDVTIRQNHIWDAKSAISIRSSGVVDGNTIERVTNGGAIEYFSDHAAPDHSSLILQNNVITTTLTNAPSALGSKRGLILLGNGIAANKAAVSAILLQNNTVRLLNTAADDSGDYFVVYIQAAAPPVKLLGNTFNNAIPNGECIGPGHFEAAPKTLCSPLPQ